MPSDPQIVFLAVSGMCTSVRYVSWDCRRDYRCETSLLVTGGLSVNSAYLCPLEDKHVYKVKITNFIKQDATKTVKNKYLSVWQTYLIL